MLFRVKPDQSKRFIVEVRIARTRRLMRHEMARFGCNDVDAKTQGLVRSYYSSVTRHQRPVAVRSWVIARMFLNRKDLTKRPSEIVAHECTHAGMAWARHRRANLAVMPGEEVLCYAVGELVKQVNRICYAAKVWK